MKARKIYLVLWLLVGVYGTGYADTMLQQMNNSGTLSFSLMHLDYQEIFLPTDESNDGVAPKSTESGDALGTTLMITKSFQELLYSELVLSYFDDSLKYEGVRVDAANETWEPFSAKFRHRFFNGRLKLGWIFTLTPSEALQVIPYAGVGYRYWFRLYDHVVAREKYQHYQGLLGLKVQYALTDSLVLAAYAESGKLFDVKMEKAKTHNRYSLGNKRVGEFGAELNYLIFDEFFIQAFANYTRFEYGRSQQTADEPFEPDSKTKELKFGLGIRYSWLVN